MCANTLRGFLIRHSRNGKKANYHLDFCCYKDTFGAVPFVTDSHDYPGRKRFPVSDWKEWKKMIFRILS
jgi:hypothetical protein